MVVSSFCSATLPPTYCRVVQVLGHRLLACTVSTVECKTTPEHAKLSKSSHVGRDLFCPGNIPNGAHFLGQSKSSKKLELLKCELMHR